MDDPCCKSQENLGIDTIAAVAAAKAYKMFTSRGGSNQEPGLAQKTLTGLAVAEAGWLIARHFKSINNDQGLSKRQMKEQAASMAVHTSLGMYNQGYNANFQGQQRYGMQQQPIYGQQQSLLYGQQY